MKTFLTVRCRLDDQAELGRVFEAVASQGIAPDGGLLLDVDGKVWFEFQSFSFEKSERPVRERLVDALGKAGIQHEFFATLSVWVKEEDAQTFARLLGALSSKHLLKSMHLLSREPRNGVDMIEIGVTTHDAEAARAVVKQLGLES